MTDLELKVEEILRLSNIIPNVFNCGIIYRNDEWICLCRKKYQIPIFVRFDENFNLKSIHQAILSEQVQLEDCRLFEWKKDLYVIGTRGTKKEKNLTQFLAKVIDNNLLLLPFNHNYPPRQKNWNAIPLDDLYFEMNPANPRRILKYNTQELEFVSEKDFVYRPHLRGNYSLLIGNKILSFYHFHVKRDYYHVAGILDNNFNVEKLSVPFKFSANNERIQFLCGVVLKNNELYFSYGINDKDNILAKCPFLELLKLFD